MSLFRLDASIRTEGSYSRQLADAVEAEWQRAHPDEPVVRREIGLDPIPASAWGLAVGAMMAGGSQPLTPEQQQAVALATEVVDELVAADALLLAVPLYNYGVSQHFKIWVDLAMTDPRAGVGAEMALAGKPAVLATVRGGAYGDGTPRHGWDHATGWMRRILADVWRLELDVVETELTLAEHRPYLSEYVGLSRELWSKAGVEAERLGRGLGRRSDRLVA